MSTPLLQLDHLARHFGGISALRDISTSVSQGELVGLIGPNGAGKTTLFNLITGFTPPSSGTVRFQGQLLSGLSVEQIARLGIARTFQNLRVFPNMSVFDNVSIGAIGRFRHGLRQIFPGRYRVRDQVTAATWAALEQVGLQGLAHEIAANLSYGKRKYMEIARALALGPSLLILDEPAAGLNDVETAELGAFLARLHRSGLTILLVEHDLNLVMGICQRVLVLASGTLIADGSPVEVANDDQVIESYLGTGEYQ